MSEEKKSRLNNLLFLGKLNTNVEINGMNIEVSTLNNKEHNSLIKKLYAIGTDVDLITIRAITLAFALRTIDGVKFDDIDVEQEFESDYDKKIFVLDNMQLSVVEKLYSEYIKLVDESKKITSSGDIKKS